jgi:hypothetical protein
VREFFCEQTEVERSGLQLRHHGTRHAPVTRWR